MMFPAVLVVKHNLSVLRKRVGDIMWKSKNKETVLREDSLFLSYWGKNIKQITRKICSAAWQPIQQV